MSFTNQEKSVDQPRRWALRGDLLDFTAAPAWGDVEPAAVRFDRDHWLLIEGGRIVGRQAAEPDASWVRRDHAGQLVLPGFIDTHVHCPQLEVIASYGTELLDWLQRYTFPAERAFADPARSRAGAEVFLDALLASGTTAVVVFPTVHKVSAEALFDGAAARGMRLITGKVLMDRHAPDGLRDDVAQAERDCIDLIDRHHGQGRNAYAVTVRFAPTSTPEQLAMAGGLCRADASLYLQTHVAENRAEVAWVAELFPQARSYLDVYERVGLVHERAVLAHGIWLDEADRRLLADRGAQVAHCPSSNLFLGSGLFDWPGAPFAVSLASDVGGGTTLSLPRNLGDAYKVQALRGARLTAWTALHAATRGAAEALRLGDEIGGLSVGQTADLCVWHWAQGPVAAARDAVARDLHERVFAWMTLADERNLAACYVAGQRRV
ncbi:MAG: guanine deaminase [Roseateles sp.]|jgi:guanine deaminase|nr:guanine deaminase [Methylibium sp.]MBY0366285.1 guanine deaminase [Burkholderiaceae bacterium]|mmetsp:Transcript_61330/g.144965  ORF Transcript_61330/g.144965 Transcript_61330/m.144965 type:complete len:436 (-) Transcript_61330:3551-4858(-)